MRDQCQDLLAGQARQLMFGEMGVVPPQNPTGGKTQPLACLRRNAADLSQIIRIGIEECLMQIRLNTWDDEAFRNNPARKLNRHVC